MKFVFVMCVCLFMCFFFFDKSNFILYCFLLYILLTFISFCCYIKGEKLFSVSVEWNFNKIFYECAQRQIIKFNIMTFEMLQGY